LARKPDTIEDVQNDVWVNRLKGHLRTGQKLGLNREPVPAAALREALLWAQRCPNEVDPRGLWIRGAVFNERVVLSRLVLPCLLGLEESRLKGGLDIGGTRLPELSLQGSKFYTLSGSDSPAISAVGAHVDGMLNLTGVILAPEAGEAVVLDRARIGGNLVLEKAEARRGVIRAHGATVGGQLNLRSASLENSGGYALNLQSAKVGTLMFDNFAKVEGQVRLVSASIGLLAMPSAGSSPVVPPGQLVADGWRVELVQGAMAGSADLAQRWLDSRPASVPYSPQPARALADTYDRAGHPDEARRLRFRAATSVARESKRPRERLWLRSYGLVVGHGYYPLLAVAWLAALFFIAAAVNEVKPDWFVPSQPVRATQAARATANKNGTKVPKPITGATTCEDLGAGYPCFARVTYALQTVAPPAAAVFNNPWQPGNGFALVLITVFKATGWVLVVLFLAGISGLLRRT
jgi:hypothetical protein